MGCPTQPYFFSPWIPHSQWQSPPFHSSHFFLSHTLKLVSGTAPPLKSLISTFWFWRQLPKLPVCLVKYTLCQCTASFTSSGFPKRGTTDILSQTFPCCEGVLCRMWSSISGLFPRLLFMLFSHSVVSDSLRLHGPQHTRLPCPSPSPRVCSKSCPLSQWCHSTTSSSVIPFPPAVSLPGSFPMSRLFASGG